MRPLKEIVLTGKYDDCLKCDRNLDIAYLVKSKRLKRGYNKLCLECNRKRPTYPSNSPHKQSTNIKKRQLILDAKNVPCPDCGVSYPPYVMDLDHLPGYEKKFQLGRYLYHTIDEIVEELKKCEAVCANCHRRRTHERANS